MGTMNISLPDGMKTFVDERVAERGYGTGSEYMHDLIRREQDRLELRKLVLDEREISSCLPGCSRQAGPPRLSLLSQLPWLPFSCAFAPVPCGPEARG